LWAGEGDVVTMKSGAVLTNIQVLRRTPLTVVVEVAPGTEPLEIPARYIADIQYDDVDLLKLRRRQALEQEESQPSILRAEELSPDLVLKMNKPIEVNPPLDFQDRDFVDVLEELGKRSGIAIEVDPSVKTLSPDARLWTVQIPEGTTMTAVREMFQKKFVAIQMIDSYDKLIVITRKALAEQAEPPVDAAKEAPEQTP